MGSFIFDRKKYLSRVQRGIYTKTDSLNKLFDRDVNPSNNELKNHTNSVEKYCEEVINKNDMEKEIFKRLESIAERLEKILDRFEIDADMKDLLIMLEDTFKKKQRGKYDRQ